MNLNRQIIFSRRYFAGLEQIIGSFYFLVLLFNLLYLESFSKENRCENIFIKGIELKKEGAITQALEYFEGALKCYEFNRDSVGWLKSSLEINYTLRSRGEVVEATEFLDSVINIFQAPYSETEKKYLVWMCIQNGFNYESINNNSKAYLSYQKAIQLISYDCGYTYYWECYDTESLGKYLIYNLSNIYKEIGEYEGTLVEIPDAFLADFEKIFNKNVGKDLALLFVHKGVANSNLDKLYEAMEYFNRAGRVPNLDLETKAIIELNKGNILRKQGLNVESLSTLDLAQNYAENLRVEDEKESLYLLGKIDLYRALALRDNKELVSALSKVQKSTQTIKNYYPSSLDNNVAEHYFLEAQLLDSLGEAEKALGMYYRSLYSLCPDFNSKEEGTLPTIAQLSSERDLVDVLVGIANFYERQSEKSQNFDFLKIALDAHELAYHIEDQIRAIYSQELSRFSVSKARNSRTAQALNIAFNYWVKNPSDELANRVFFFMEKNRAQELQSDLMRQELSLKLGKDAQKLETAYRIAEYTWQKAKRDLALAQKSGSQNLQTLDKLLVSENNTKTQLKRIKDELDLILEKETPGYLNLKSHPNIIQLQELQTTLSEEEGFISFYNSSSHIYSLYISRENISFNQIPLTKPLSVTIDSLKFLLRRPLLSLDQRNDYQDYSVNLYQKLLQNIVEPHIARLLVAPCPLLYGLPLETLLTDELEGNDLYNYHKWPYAWKSLELCYVFSGTLYKGGNFYRKKTPYTYLGYAPDYGQEHFSISRVSNRRDVGELRYNTTEVLKVDSLFHLLGEKHQIYLNYNATKEAFMQTSGSAQILHVALHAFAGEDSVNIPYLLFAPDSSVFGRQVNIDTNRLYSYEVPLLDVSSELLILSACNSGLGRVVSGEGVMNFARAFRIAGVPNTIMSLWEVDDFAPSEIIPSFVSGLKLGLTKTQALNEARRAYLENPIVDNKLKSPFFWSHFILVGNPAPMFSAPNPSFGETIQANLQRFYLKNPGLFWFALILLAATVGYILFISLRQLKI